MMLALAADGCLRRSWINIFAAATSRTCPWGRQAVGVRADAMLSTGFMLGRLFLFFGDFDITYEWTESG